MILSCLNLHFCSRLSHPNYHLNFHSRLYFSLWYTSWNSKHMFGSFKNFLKEKTAALGGLQREHSDNCGFRVVNVEVDGPAASAGIEPYYDFIIGANGYQLVRNE